MDEYDAVRFPLLKIGWRHEKTDIKPHTQNNTAAMEKSGIILPARK